MESDKVLHWTAENSKLPLFAFWDFAVDKKGAIGGYVQSGYEQGKQAAEMAEALINGQSHKKIGIVSGKSGRWLFSRAGLDRYKMKLPENMRIRAELVD